MKFRDILEILVNEDRTIPIGLGESFTPRPVPYGTDGTNRQWGKSKDIVHEKDFNYTFFYSYPNYYIVMIYDDGWIKFNVVDVDEIDAGSYTIDYAYKFNDFTRVPTNNPSMLFTSIFNVILEGILYFNNIHEFYFRGADQKLQKLYKQLTTHKLLLSSIRDKGFEFVEIDSVGNIIFRRIPQGE
jgi:hypothetical protein